MKNDSLSTKIKVLIVSIILVAGVIIVYSIDKEQRWGERKDNIMCSFIFLCILFFTND